MQLVLRPRRLRVDPQSDGVFFYCGYLAWLSLLLCIVPVAFVRRRPPDKRALDASDSASGNQEVIVVRRGIAAQDDIVVSGVQAGTSGHLLLAGLNLLPKENFVRGTTADVGRGWA